MLVCWFQQTESKPNAPSAVVTNPDRSFVTARRHHGLNFVAATTRSVARLISRDVTRLRVRRCRSPTESGVEGGPRGESERGEEAIISPFVDTESPKRFFRPRRGSYAEALRVRSAVGGEKAAPYLEGGEGGIQLDGGIHRSIGGLRTLFPAYS